MDYINRQGDRYRIFQGKTKSGKPKYFASKRETSEKGVKVASLQSMSRGLRNVRVRFQNPHNK